VVREGKLRVLRGPLRADMGRLARRFAPLMRESVTPVKAAERTLMVKSIIRLVAALPVYRTYIDGRDPEPREADRDALTRAFEGAMRDAPEEERQVLERLKAVFLSPLAEDDVFTAARLDFILRFQQMSGPATAKGVEDTALYVHVPLASRNEVGGEPDAQLGDAVAQLHAANVERAERWPQTILATNTHDTKRSADVRARLDVLSESPHMMRRYFARWRRLNRRHRRVVGGRLLPDTNTEYLLYQTLLGMWPPPRTGRRRDDLPDHAWLGELAERVRGYAEKAVREAKRFTSWTDPDADYERAVAAFVDAILDPRQSETFLADLSRFTSLLSHAGFANTIARITLHLTSPGTPDIYQGDELWNYTLVDPDNRQPVDFARRSGLLEELHRREPAELLGAPERDEVKLWVTSSLLAARRQHPGLFTTGSYVPVEARGDDGTLFAFARLHGADAAVVAVRRSGPVSGGRGPVEREVPPDAELLLPGELHGRVARRVLGEGVIRITDQGGRAVVRAADLLGTMPANMLVAEVGNP
jgi:(1->4)-alpha-D-glucan 1-alpha-D-glucosylmutase